MAFFRGPQVPKGCSSLDLEARRGNIYENDYPPFWTMPSNLENKAELKKVLVSEGVRAGLRFLNGLSTHRFSALYRFDEKILKNLYFFDRENPEKERMDEIPVLASYCVFVRDSRQTFNVENSILDPRTVNHPKRLEILAYCGVPLLDRYGKMFGTICHFDVSPRRTTSNDVELMEEMADLLQERIDEASSSGA